MSKRGKHQGKLHLRLVHEEEPNVHTVFAIGKTSGVKRKVILMDEFRYGPKGMDHLFSTYFLVEEGAKIRKFLGNAIKALELPETERKRKRVSMAKKKKLLKH